MGSHASSMDSHLSFMGSHPRVMDSYLSMGFSLECHGYLFERHRVRVSWVSFTVSWVLDWVSQVHVSNRFLFGCRVLHLWWHLLMSISSDDQFEMDSPSDKENDIKGLTVGAADAKFVFRLPAWHTSKRSLHNEGRDLVLLVTLVKVKLRRYQFTNIAASLPLSLTPTCSRYILNFKELASKIFSRWREPQIVSEWFPVRIG